MAVLREKTLSYRRVEWFGDGNAPGFEKCIRQALAQLKTVEERTINQDGRTAKVRRSKTAQLAVSFLHGDETPGEAALVVPKAAADADALDAEPKLRPTMVNGLMAMLFFMRPLITFPYARQRFTSCGDYLSRSFVQKKPRCRPIIGTSS